MSELSVILPEKLKISAGWGDTKIQWSLKMITVSEEQSYLDRILASKEDDKNAGGGRKEYDAGVDAIVAWSTDMPIIIKGSERQPLSTEEDFGAAIRNFFSDRSVAKERLLHTSILQYRSAMIPDVSFL